MHPGFLGHQPCEDPPQAHGLLAQFGTQPPLPRGGRVPLVEHQVEDLQHVGEASVAVLTRGHLERNLLLGQPPLGPHDALGDGGLRHEEGTGDLVGGEPAEQAEGERDPGLGGQHGVTAHEHEFEQVVAVVLFQDGVELRLPVAVGDFPAEFGRAFPEAFVPAPTVEDSTFGDGGQPGSGTARDALVRPLLQGRDQGVLREFLGRSDIADHARQGRDQASRLDPPDRLHLARHIRVIHRTMTAPADRVGKGRSGLSLRLLAQDALSFLELLGHVVHVLQLSDPAQLELHPGRVALGRVRAALGPLHGLGV